jgi:hypothetical protein
MNTPKLGETKSTCKHAAMNLLKAKAQASWLKKMSQVLWITEEN